MIVDMFLQYSKHVLCVERKSFIAFTVFASVLGFFVFHKSNDLCDEMVNRIGPPRVHYVDRAEVADVVAREDIPRIFQTLLSSNVLFSF